MQQNSTTASFDGVFLHNFLAAIDQVSDRLGMSVPALVDLEVLRQLPPETLGRSLADHLDQQQLQPFLTGPRRKQLHDSVHVLTGYDTSPIGEAEVQAFLLGTKFQLTHLLLGLGLLRLIHKRCPHCPNLWQLLWHAYQRGCASSFNIDRWQPENQWTLPLDQVQRLLQV